MSNPHVGSSFDDFLLEQGMYEEVKADALARVLQWIQDEMEKQEISKVEMANRMGTSRSQLDRILQGTMEDIRLGTFYKAAQALGKDVKITLVDSK